MLVESDADAHPSLEVLPVWWQDRAACVGVDPEVFFPSAGHDAAEARAVCVNAPASPTMGYESLLHGRDFGQPQP